MRARTLATMTMMLLVALLIPPVVSGAKDTPAPSDDPAAATDQKVDLSPALAADGAFIGADQFSGTVDTEAWTLVSDLAAGEPPRFEPTANNLPAAGTVEWSALGSNGAGNGALSGSIYAIAISGTDIYVGGGFNNAAGIAEADHIARWNGNTWSALGSNGPGVGALNRPVYALALAGTDLYVGGWFADAAGIAAADGVARWNGSAWSALGAGLPTNGAPSDIVHALALSGGSVYVGGAFTNVAGMPEADYLVRWNGSAWSALGSNGVGNGALNDEVRAVVVAGTDIYAGGDFTDIGGDLTADYVARWNGSAWSSLGSNGTGNGALNNAVYALAISGSDLYVGGAFTNAANIGSADRIARWSGSTWSGLGSTSIGQGPIQNIVRALVTSGNDLYAAGLFTDVAGIPEADRVARWNGSAWSAVGSNGAGNGALNSSSMALAVSGAAMYVGGGFSNAAGTAAADFVAVAVTAGSWFPMGSNGTGNGALNNYVLALAVSGDDLYVGGIFNNAAGIAQADAIVRWNGSEWSALGSNVAGTDGAIGGGVWALAVSGPDLYIGGAFNNVAGISKADYIARWNGSVWSALGSNLAGTDGALNSNVLALSASGADLYVGGVFTNAAGIAQADRVARWNGSAWSALGSNIGGTDGALGNVVYALAVSANDVYVGGLFTNAAGLDKADRVARWNGSAWSALGSNVTGTDGALTDVVYALAIWGADLYVGGQFNNAAGIAQADMIARWNGSGWSALGSNGAGNGALNHVVEALVVSGGNLYVGGHFANAAAMPAADRVARWDGSGWSTVALNGTGNGSLGAPVRALAASGAELYVGGDFQNADGIPKGDYVVTVGPIPAYQPDGRIKKGTGALGGDDIYNGDGTGQARTGQAAVGATITFTTSIQNDGDASDRFRVAATGAATSKYTVNYFSGTTNITAAVVAGTYKTSNLAPGATFAIKATVKVLATANVGSSVTRLVTLTSDADPGAIDAVKFTGKRS